jgi:hypothetical protein
MFLGSITIILLYAQISFAWGERGHHIVGYSAAKLVDTWTTADDRNRFGEFFTSRAIQMGHLNNIPDISWKATKDTELHSLNRPTHYLNSEFYYESPSADLIRELPTSWAQLNQKYQTQSKEIFKKGGTAPWRVGQLANHLKDRFDCIAKSKNDKDKPPTSSALFGKPPKKINLKACSPKDPVRQNAYEAAVLAGIMGHFIADLSQPLHVTKDSDADSTGQLGLHHYFESHVVMHLDETLPSEVIEKAKNSDFRKNAIQKLGLTSAKYNATQVALNLAADSWELRSKLLQLDEKNSLIQKSEKKNELAFRKSESDANVLKAYREFIIDRLALSALALSYVWHQEWQAGGRPALTSILIWKEVYPVDVPFIKPNY